jgi:zinc protease
MSRTLLGSVLLATGLALAAPQAPPTPGPTPPLELPTTTVFTLKNGLQVTLVPYGAIPKTNVATRTRRLTRRVSRT